jgi:hypothetical protein
MQLGSQLAAALLEVQLSWHQQLGCLTLAGVQGWLGVVVVVW